MKIPTLDSLSPKLTELRATKAEYHAEISKRKIECQPIRTRLQNAAPDPGNERLNRVNALLGRATAPSVEPDAARLHSLLVEIQDLQNAVCYIDGQIQTETRIAGNKLLEAVKPELVRLGKKFAQAFLSLRSEHHEYNQFVDLIEDAGGSVSSLRITPNGLSDPRDASGSYAYGLREFVEAGFLPKSVVPEAI